MSCEQFSDDYELYVLGALDRAEADAFREHLASGCPTCRDELQRALLQNEVLSRTAPLVDPPARLRQRVWHSVASPRPSRLTFLPWAVALASVLALAIGLTLDSQARVRERQHLTRLRAAEAGHLTKALEIAEASGTRQVAITPTTPEAPRGSLFIHQKLGIAVFVRQLRPAPPGWRYESWLLPKQGPPQPSDLLEVDERGRGVAVLPGPLDTENLKAVGVSLERQHTRPTKPTTIVFVAGT